MDGAHVVFGASSIPLTMQTASNAHAGAKCSGEVVENYDLVKTIEGYGTASGKTKKTVEIYASGTL